MEMNGVEPKPETKLSPRFSSDVAVATEWAQGRRDLEEAELYWLSTVRPDGRPHVTPLLGIWLDGALYFCTGPDERKAKNLEQNQQCILTTGSNNLDGLDLVIEGEAAEVNDEPELRTVADTYHGKDRRHIHCPSVAMVAISMRANNPATAIAPAHRNQTRPTLLGDRIRSNAPHAMTPTTQIDR